MTDEGGEAISATPEVTDPHVTQSKPPVDFERVDSNVLASTGACIREGDLDVVRGTWTRDFTLRDDTRIVIDGIANHDLDTNETMGEKCIQVYKNQEGFLVADKAFRPDGISPWELERRPQVRLSPRDEEGTLRLSVDTSAPPMRSINDRRQLMSDGSLQLTTTTLEWPKLDRDGGFDPSVRERAEISVYSPDDTGNHVRVTIWTGMSMVKRLPEPIVVRQVPELRESI